MKVHFLVHCSIHEGHLTREESHIEMADKLDEEAIILLHDNII